MKKVWDAILDFNDAHGKATACIVSFAVGFITGGILI